MIIKATRLQAWAPAGGGARVGLPPPSKKRSSLAILGALLLRFSHFWGPFHHVGAFFATIYFMVGAFFGACPPPPQKFLRAPKISRRVREHALRKFFV